MIRKRWLVTFGKSTHAFYTWYHAAGYSRALTMNGTAHIVSEQLFRLVR